jgi:hypothetical protein
MPCPVITVGIPVLPRYSIAVIGSKKHLERRDRIHMCRPYAGSFDLPVLSTVDIFVKRRGRRQQQQQHHHHHRQQQQQHHLVASLQHLTI